MTLFLNDLLDFLCLHSIKLFQEFLRWNILSNVCLHTVKQFQVLLFNISNSISQVFLRRINNFLLAVWIQITNNNNPD